MKRRNRTWGYKRIAQQIALTFGVVIDKDVVRRTLGTHFRPEVGSGGPSWLSFIGHAKDLFRQADLLVKCSQARIAARHVERGPGDHPTGPEGAYLIGHMV